MQKLARLGSALLVCLGLNILTTLPSLALAAFRLAPIDMTFEPSGSGTTRSFRVESLGDEPVAVQIHMGVRQVALDGTETNPEADNDFQVYPPQIVLKPGQQQTVRVSWLGDANPSKELSYRIIAEQLPINLQPVEQNQNGISFQVKTLLRYVASVYVTPKGTAPKVVVNNVTHQKGKEGADELVITFENQGNAHGFLNKLNLHLTPVGSDGKSAQGAAVHLKPEQLKGVSDENILAGNKRQFIIPWPAGLPVGPVNATFDVKSEE